MMAASETRSILLAEDNRVNHRIATAMLAKRGHRIDIANNGFEAVAMTRDNNYDVILMDLCMPGMDGLEATRKIRELAGKSELPIVALCAHARAVERVGCLAAGMDAFLGKPFREHELLTLVENATRAPANDTARGIIGVSPVDLDAFRDAMQEVGIEEVVDTTLAAFCAEMPERMVALKKALENLDVDGIASLAKAMKSAAGAIHAVALATTMNNLENAANEGDVSTARGLAQEANAKFSDVMTFLGIAPG